MKAPHLALVASLVACANQETPAAKPPASSAAHMEITKAGTQPTSRGPAAMFVGSVVVTPLFRATDATRASGAYVAFEPGAHSAWHTHPAGQTLVVTAGTGWVQEWGGEKREIKVGDVIWTPPGVKHWHGATATEGMTHLAIQEHVGGKVVEWLEQVGEDHYRN